MPVAPQTILDRTMEHARHFSYRPDENKTETIDKVIGPWHRWASGVGRASAEHAVNTSMPPRLRLPTTAPHPRSFEPSDEGNHHRGPKKLRKSAPLLHEHVAARGQWPRRSARCRHHCLARALSLATSEQTIAKCRAGSTGLITTTLVDHLS
jgi:hypothetical protein